MTEGQNKRQRAALQPRLPATAPHAARPAAAGGDDVDEPVPRPDVFEYFAQRANRSKELEQEMDRLKAREAALDRRVQDAELQLSRMKAELGAAAARHEGREAQLQLKCDLLENSIQREVERAAVLEVQLRHRSEAISGAGAAKTSIADEVAGFLAPEEAEAIRALKLKISALEMALTSTKAEAEGNISSLDGELQAERQRTQAETAAVTALQRRVEEAEAQLDTEAAARREAEARAAELEATVMQTQAAAASRNTSEGDAILIKSLREQLTTAEAGAAEAARLKQQAATAASLREKLDAAESRARCAEQLLEGEAAVHAELADAQEQLQRWTAILSGMADCATPEDVLHMVVKLQDAQISAKAGDGDKAEELATLRAEAEAAEAAARDATTRAEAATARAEAMEVDFARLDRKAQLLTQERDSLQSVLASYDEEYLSKEDGLSGEISPAQRRIAELEATVEALHGHMKSLETELGAGSVAAAGSADVIAEANTKILAAEARAHAAESEVENLAKQVELLEERVGRGEYNPETTKVLHFKGNPEAELYRAAKEARIAELESENEALRQSLQRVEAATALAAGTPGAAPGGDGSTLTPGVAVVTASGGLRVAQLEGEANLLRRRLAEAQKTSDRLQQVFTKQIATFRDAIKGLFGYSVEMTSDPAAKEIRAQFILRPQHADEAGAELAFKMLRDGRIAFVKTEYSTRRLAREVETFVDRYRSVPAFTANLTMENFQRHTQG
jgi:mitotic spindle assembly checkpoint protein MAD1